MPVTITARYNERAVELRDIASPEGTRIGVEDRRQRRAENR